MPGNLLKVKVGSAAKAKTFHIERDLICQVSSFIRETLSNPWVDDVSFETHEPVAFDLFLKWIYGHETPEVYIPLQLAEEPWLSSGANICLLAMKLKCLNFEKEALSHFIQSCAFAPFGPWGMIEREAPEKTSLRRFSNHWVAWNHYLAGRGKNEYTSLQAASMASGVTEKTRDPRVYDLEHWFSNCGDSLAPGCPHDPISRKEILEQKAIKRKPVPLIKNLAECKKERALQAAASNGKTKALAADSKTTVTPSQQKAPAARSANVSSNTPRLRRQSSLSQISTQPPTPSPPTPLPWSRQNSQASSYNSPRPAPPPFGWSTPAAGPSFPITSPFGTRSAFGANPAFGAGSIFGNRPTFSPYQPGPAMPPLFNPWSSLLMPDIYGNYPPGYYNPYRRPNSRWP